jgi:hypothetical protein
LIVSSLLERSVEHDTTMETALVEFMQPWEAGPFCEDGASSREELDLVAWRQVEQHGRFVYRADIGTCEVDARASMDSLSGIWFILTGWPNTR